VEREIRLLETGANNCFFNMALDQVLAENVGNVPVLRFYQWEPPAATIGYFQKLEHELDTNACKSLGFFYTRRITGGGAVVHQYELTYSFITREYPINILESYKWICQGIIIGLKKLGFNPEFSGLNDITINSKKISGNAQTRKNGVLLQHGTILLSVDVETMFKILKVPNEKLKDKLISSVKERVIGLETPEKKVRDAIKAGFSESMNATLSKSCLTKDEISAARLLAIKKFANPNWIVSRKS